MEDNILAFGFTPGAYSQGSQEVAEGPHDLWNSNSNGYIMMATLLFFIFLFF